MTTLSQQLESATMEFVDALDMLDIQSNRKKNKREQLVNHIIKHDYSKESSVSVLKTLLNNASLEQIEAVFDAETNYTNILAEINALHNSLAKSAHENISYLKEVKLVKEAAALENMEIENEIEAALVVNIAVGYLSIKHNSSVLAALNAATQVLIDTGGYKLSKSRIDTVVKLLAENVSTIDAPVVISTDNNKHPKKVYHAKTTVPSRNINNNVAEPKVNEKTVIKGLRNIKVNTSSSSSNARTATEHPTKVYHSKIVIKKSKSVNTNQDTVPKVSKVTDTNQDTVPKVPKTEVSDAYQTLLAKWKSQDQKLTDAVSKLGV